MIFPYESTHNQPIVAIAQRKSMRAKAGKHDAGQSGAMSARAATVRLVRTSVPKVFKLKRPPFRESVIISTPWHYRAGPVCASLRPGSSTILPSFNLQRLSVQQSVKRLTLMKYSAPNACQNATGAPPQPTKINFVGGAIQKLITRVTFPYLPVQSNVYSNRSARLHLITSRTTWVLPFDSY